MSVRSRGAPHFFKKGASLSTAQAFQTSTENPCNDRRPVSNALSRPLWLARRWSLGPVRPPAPPLAAEPGARAARGGWLGRAEAPAGAEPRERAEALAREAPRARAEAPTAAARAEAPAEERRSRAWAATNPSVRSARRRPPSSAATPTRTSRRPSTRPTCANGRGCRTECRAVRPRTPCSSKPAGAKSPLACRPIQPIPTAVPSLAAAL
jgi:hypothetical protein